MIIGITGGTGSGKTTLLEILRQRGALVLDCDAIYHELLQTNPKLLQEIKDRFPGTVVNGQLNRKLLGAMADRASRRRCLPRDDGQLRGGQG